MNTQGCDISVWQDDNSTSQMFDFPKARSRGLSFVGIKVSQANWADPDYIKNWYAARNYLYRMPYHFLTWDVKPATQAEIFWSLIEKDLFGVLPLVCDFEWWKTVPAKAMDILYNFTFRLKKLSDPLPLGIYSSFEFWKESGSNSDYWKPFHLWLCDIEGKIDIPKPWLTYSFHQYTFKGDGLFYGAESKGLDMNWYNGTIDQMISRYNLPDIGLLNPTQPKPEPISRIVRVNVPDGLRLRSQPSIIGKRLGVITAGSELEVIDKVEDSGNKWVKVSGWIAEEFNGQRMITDV